MRGVVENTHAQECWLRMAANTAIERAITCPPMCGDALSELLYTAENLTGKARVYARDGSDYVSLQHIEAAASTLLRAAVILRREETRQRR